MLILLVRIMYSSVYLNWTCFKETILSQNLRKIIIYKKGSMNIHNGYWLQYLRTNNILNIYMKIDKKNKIINFQK